MPLKYSLLIFLIMTLFALIPTVYAESEYGDLSQSQPELQAQLQAKADTEAKAQGQTALQKVIDDANTGGYRVAVYGPNGEGTIYGNNLPPQDARAVEAQATAEYIANQERALREGREAFEAAKAWGNQTVMGGREAVANAPSGVDKGKLAAAQANDEKALAESNAAIDKMAAEHEMKVKTEIEKQKERLRVLVSMEKDKK